MSDMFDFGFTAVDEDELDAVQQAQKVAVEAEGAADKLNELYNAMIPLLSNLKKNPDKDYIYWPNRIEKVEQFEEHLYKIFTK